MGKRTILLPDGYNGHMLRFYTDPIARDGNLVKLQCAELGREYLIRWARQEDIKSALVLP